MDFSKKKFYLQKDCSRCIRISNANTLGIIEVFFEKVQIWPSSTSHFIVLRNVPYVSFTVCQTILSLVGAAWSQEGFCISIAAIFYNGPSFKGQCGTVARQHGFVVQLCASFLIFMQRRLFPSDLYLSLIHIQMCIRDRRIFYGKR